MLSVHEFLLGLAFAVALVGRDLVDFTIALPAYGLGNLAQVISVKANDDVV